MFNYVITCVGNAKFYVGSSSDLKKRREKHFRTLRKGQHVNKHLQSAWDLYGEESFSFEVLETCLSKADMLEREQYWVDKLKVLDKAIGFNLCPVVGSTLGFKHTEETKKKMSKAKMGGKASRGYKHTPEAKAKIAAATKARHAKLKLGREPQ